MLKFLRYKQNMITFQIFSISVLISTLLGCKKDLEKAPITLNPDTTITTKTYAKILPVSLFDANLTKNGNLSAYQFLSGDAFTAMVIDPSRISVVNDPVFGTKRKVMYMDVRNQDTGGLTENPRAQVQTPMNYVSGQSIYVGLSVRFTQSMWTYFLTFAEFYGAPYSGTSPFRMAVQGSDLVASATSNGKQTNLWQAPLQTNVWYDFVYHEVLSKSSNRGLVEVWLRKQGETTFTQIVSATKIPTITSSNITGPNYHKLACYYDKNNTYTDATKKTHLMEVKMYLGNHKVGSSFNAVAPTLLN